MERRTLPNQLTSRPASKGPKGDPKPDLEAAAVEAGRRAELAQAVPVTKSKENQEEQDRTDDGLNDANRVQ